MRESLNQKKNRASGIISILRAKNPHPKSELFYRTPFQFLVSVVLSAQTTDKMVNRCMEPLYKDKATPFTPSLVLELGERRFLEKIKSIGLAPTKARHVVKLAELLIRQHHEKVPATRCELEALPGVGRKSANVILSVLYKEPVIAVDTHVLRVSMRLGFHRETSPMKCEQALLALFSKSDLRDAHHLLVLHGRYVCKARKPSCSTCPIGKLCPKWGIERP